MKTNTMVAFALISVLAVSSSIYAYGEQWDDIERPDNWTEMTQEERQSFLEANGIEMKGTRSKLRIANPLENQLKMNQVQNRYNISAQKAGNYQKFTGELKQKREFIDGSQIRNKEAVEFLQQRGILDGYGDGSFKPENPINRAESIKVLLESIGEAPDTEIEDNFVDVPADAWFSGYVAKAKRQGIIKGYEDGTFRPAQTVNQVELLKIAFETFGIDLSDYPITDLIESDMNAWYAPYLQYAVDNNLLETMALGEGMTREAFPEVIYRLIQQQEMLVE